MKEEKDFDYRKDVEPEENEMTEDMEDVRALGKEMEQISQNEDYPVDSSDDESHGMDPNGNEKQQ
ncbi:SAS053 family DNA gyrase inhibitor [Salinicoccus carnicancri]|uniref:SAS053 family DNA gyrase inhibitor n=1 Tax=Salinicoccus carnicancri TaxID=558170 RepID=UPI00031DF8A6|nr:SAS053 family protein [Salinicoccus carnicancri]